MPTRIANGSGRACLVRVAYIIRRLPPAARDFELACLLK